MKQLHTSEIKNISKELESFLDSKLQKFFASNSGIGFELRQKDQSRYLWFDLTPVKPCILLFDRIPSVIKLLKTSPLILFAKAHAEGKRLSQIVHQDDLGRVIEFYFGYDDPVKIEVRLFPHGTNVIIQSERKKISFDKVKEIKPQDSVTEIENPRDLLTITKEWAAQDEHKTKSKDPEALRLKEIQKKESSLAKMRVHLDQLTNDVWKELGGWLKENQSLDVPDKYKDKIDTQKSFSHNLQNCFQKAKKNQEKISGTLVRIAILEREISEAKAKDAQDFIRPQAQAKNKKNDGWKGYRFQLNEKVEVFVGKNAQENLNILRFAQSWDYWLHIKDYPGAHGIIRRSRNLDVSDEDLRTAAVFVASKSRKSAHFLSPGDSFEALVVECRFVKPIKGDKLGRVIYSNERVIKARMPLK